MASYIVYRSQKLTSLHLHFSPDIEFRVIVDNLGEIFWPPLPVNPELVTFAILELVSNSIRAHREKGVTEPVRVELKAESGELSACVLDAGRGFDPSLLPYDINAGVESINVMSEEFSHYRDNHQGKRFGMGLYVARKTFKRFSLDFVDSQERSCPWYSGKVKGTRIELVLPITEGLVAFSLPHADGARDVQAVELPVEDAEEVGEYLGLEGVDDV